MDGRELGSYALSLGKRANRQSGYDALASAAAKAAKDKNRGACSIVIRVLRIV